MDYFLGLFLSLTLAEACPSISMEALSGGTLAVKAPVGINTAVLTTAIVVLALVNIWVWDGTGGTGRVQELVSKGRNM